MRDYHSLRRPLSLCGLFARVAPFLLYYLPLSAISPRPKHATQFLLQDPMRALFLLYFYLFAVLALRPTPSRC